MKKGTIETPRMRRAEIDTAINVYFYDMGKKRIRLPQIYQDIRTFLDYFYTGGIEGEEKAKSRMPYILEACKKSNLPELLRLYKKAKPGSTKKRNLRTLLRITLGDKKTIRAVILRQRRIEERDRLSEKKRMARAKMLITTYFRKHPKVRKG